ncbi:hypothetical protein HY638_06120 [Candidatus Woesearchaeota archaeon]|nr:hypothetical protein [Candidatus Woesearchaeota archaeon]
MQPEKNFLETNIHCITLYKAAIVDGFTLPPPNVHVYLAGIIATANDHHMATVNSGFVVGSIDELARISDMFRNDPQPNAVPYLVGRYSGDFFLYFNALSGEGHTFPSACYHMARFHGARMGKTGESDVLRLIALNPERCMKLLALHHRFISDSPKITEEDYTDFRAYVKREQKKRVYP